MSPFIPSRRAALLLALVMLGTGTLLAGVMFGQPASGRKAADLPRSAAPAGGPGVVCFGTVDLEHGVASLSPLQPGRVAEVLVRENDVVTAGAVLLRIDDSLARSRLAEAQAALEAAQTQLAQARKGPDAHRGRIAQQQDAVAAMGFKVSAARRLLERQQKLVEPKLTSPQEVAAAQDQVKELEALERAEKQRLADLKAQDPELDVRRAEKEVAVLQAKLDQARLGIEECKLKAPKAGTVLRLLAGPGDVVGGMPKQPAVLFAAAEALIVRAEVEQEFAGRVAVGQAAVVQDEANPDTSWHGKVERIAHWYSQRRSVMNTQLQMTDVRTVECLVTLNPGPASLRIGQRVRVLIGTVE
jgi:multidrug resistance efflux pump